MYYSYVESPVGDILIAGDEKGLRLVNFPTGKMKRAIESDWEENNRALKEPIKQLKEYFAGNRKTFDLKLAPDGTEFQLSVLKALQKIPYGETCSYGDIAKKIGRPKASRAVGAANGRNPLSIVIPCHRVIGQNGDLTGFGGGLKTKKVLLELEQKA